MGEIGRFVFTKTKIIINYNNLRRTTALFFVLLLLFTTVQLTLIRTVVNAQSERTNSQHKKREIKHGRKIKNIDQAYKDARKPKVLPSSFDVAQDTRGVKLAPTSEAGKQTATSPVMNIIKKNPELDKGKEKTDRRSAFSRTYENKNGGEATEVTALPQNYKSSDGKLKAITDNMVEDAAYAEKNKVTENILERILPGTKQPISFVAPDGSIKAHFETLGKGAIRFIVDEKEFSLTPVGANNVRPEKQQDKNGNTYIKYANVWDGVDLVYEYHGVIVKENIILRNADAASRFAFSVDGVKVRASEDGKELLLGAPFEGRIKFGAVSVQAGESGILSHAPVTQKAINDGTSISVELDNKWVKRQPKKNFPIVIDPAPVDLYGIPGGDQGLYWSYKSDGYSCNYTNCPINVGGLNDGGAKYWRSMMRLPFDNASGRQLLGADIYLPMSVNPNTWNGNYDTRTVWVTWAPCFGYSCNNGGAPVISGQVSTSGQFNITPIIQWMIDNGQWGGWLMVTGEETTSSYKRLDAGNVRLVLYTNRHPSQPAPELPSNNPGVSATVTSTVPQLKVSKVWDPDGDAVHYQFIVKSSSGGVIWQSDPTPSRQTIVPEGLLQDGGSYSWTYKYAEYASGSSYYWISGEVTGGTFKVNLPNEKGDSQTYDTLGPISVDLASGKASTSVSSHSIAALGGNIGIKLNYESPYLSKPGLRARYWTLPASSVDTPQYQRIEPNVNADWDLGSPVPGVIPADNYMAIWDGYFVAPVSGNYYFGGIADNTLDVTLSSIDTFDRVLDLDNASSLTWSSVPVYLKAGEVRDIGVNHTEHLGSSKVELWVKGPVAEQIIPSEWLRTPALPTGQDSGLTGHYFYDNATHNPSTTSRFLVRQDANVDFAWGPYAPSPGAPADSFFVRWEGYFTAPVPGTYNFGVGGDDGVRVIVDGVERAGLWYDHGYQETYDPNGMFLTEGQTVPIIMEYYDAGGAASARLLLDGPTGYGLIDPQFLSPNTRSLPKGWELSIDNGDVLAFERLYVKPNGDIALYDGDGSNHLYTITGSGYKPPAGDTAILIKNADGTYTLTAADGRVYVFDIDGTLKLTSMPVDDKKPVALKYEYTTVNGVPRLKRIIDAVDPERYGTLHYFGEPDGQCVSDDDTIPGMLCSFETTNSQSTTLGYYMGALWYFSTPGGGVTWFESDTHDVLRQIATTTAIEAYVNGITNTYEALYTDIEYDDTGRVLSVTAPAAKDGDLRAKHTLEYLPGSTKRHVADKYEPHGYTQYVEYDNQLRTTKVCDVQALCTTNEYDQAKDLVLSSTDAKGLKSTTIYDDEDRPVDSYGPAPASWFGLDRKPLAQYVSQVPHNTSRYDESIVGPQVTYYNYLADTSQTNGTGGSLVDAPRLHAKGINTTPGVLDKTWATPPITVDANMHGWGERLTGMLRLPSTGQYAISIQHTDGVKLWLDDKLAVNAWNDGALRTEADYIFNYTAAQSPIKFVLDQYTRTQTVNPTIKVSIRQINGFAATTDWTSYLSPSYGFITSSTAYDSEVGNAETRTTYTNPAYGIPGVSTTDPSGMAYTTSTAYEAAGTTFMRQTSKTLPGGTVTTYQHYAAQATRDNPCTPDFESYRQAGFVKGRTGVDPDGAGPQVAYKTEVVYDDAGRQVANRINTEAWTCTEYDERGRVSQVVIPTVGTRVGRTITYDYSYFDNPLVTAVSDPNGQTITQVDVLGRIVSFTDALGHTTDNYIDEHGTLMARYGYDGIGWQDYTYDEYGRLKESGLEINGQPEVLVKIGYDNYGVMNLVEYPLVKDPVTGGTLKMNEPPRDLLDRLIGVSYTLPNTAQLTNTVSRSQSGVITDEFINGVDLSSGAKSYTYDKVGRLTQANIAGHTYGYDFTNADAACATKTNNFANAGKNSNRLKATVDGVTTWYCYNSADQLIASSNAALDAPTYDSHGNTLTLGTGTSATTFKYDQSDRNTEISQGTTKIVYKRDHNNRIIQRKVTKNGTTTTYYYGSTGSQDYGFMYTNNTTQQVVEIYMSLPGGVSLTLRPQETLAASKVRASLFNMHGDTLAVLNGDGVNETGVMLYDPFGSQIGPTAAFAAANTGIAFASASTVTDNMKGDQGSSWASAARRNKENLFAINPMQMGARVYIPGLGRFLSVDPVDGGTANDYVYVGDPINNQDYAGTFGIGFITRVTAAVVAVGAASVAVMGVAACIATLVCGIAAGIMIAGAVAASIAAGSIAVTGNPGNKVAVIAGAAATLGLSVRSGGARTSSTIKVAKVNPQQVSASYKSSLSIGQAAHTEFSAMVRTQGGIANQAVFQGSRVRPDGYFPNVNGSSLTLELKPGNPQGVTAGHAQLQGYTNLSGGQGQLWLYNQNSDGSFNFWQY